MKKAGHGSESQKERYPERNEVKKKFWGQQERACGKERKA